MKTNTKKLTAASLLCAFAYIVMLISKIIPEVAGFLQLDLKDVVIVSGGFILGPASALIISFVVSLLELLTVSNTGIIGMIMNVVSTAAFCCTAAIIYKYFRTVKGAVASLIFGTIALTVVMLLWNYYITPLYMKVPRDVVVSMLIPVFLPFNLIKGLINSSLTLVLYKPLVKSLSKARLINSYTASKGSTAISPLPIIGIVVLVVCIPFLLNLMGII